MLTGRFRQSTLERLRYTIDIALDGDERISGLEVLDADGLTIEELVALPPDFVAYQFMVSGGDAGRVHSARIRVTTSLGQQRVDRLDIIMRGAA